MSDNGELNAENEEDLWAEAADDMVKQKEMLREAAGEGEEETPAEEAEAPIAETPEAPAQQQKKASENAPSEVERILDLPLQLSVELGRAKMLINDLMQLGQGSVIELTKLVGEPLEILVNEKLVGKGEVVVVNEKFGVRITEVSTPQERIESMS